LSPITTWKHTHIMIIQEPIKVCLCFFIDLVDNHLFLHRRRFDSRWITLRMPMQFSYRNDCTLKVSRLLSDFFLVIICTIPRLVETDESLYLLALSYYRSGKPNATYAILSEKHTRLCCKSPQ